MSLYRCPSCAAGYTESHPACVVCGHVFRRTVEPVDTDEHSPYYERKSKADAEAIGAFAIIGALVIFAGVALWKAFA